MFWTPRVVVNPVQDTVKITLALLENPFQSTSEFRGLDLLGVSWTYRSQDIRVDEPGLQEIHVPVIFQALRAEGPFGEARKREGRSRKPSLISQVMDCKCGLRLTEKIIISVKRVQISRDEPALPVVAVHDIGCVSEVFEQCERGTEKNENRSALSG